MHISPSAEPLGDSFERAWYGANSRSQTAEGVVPNRFSSLLMNLHLGTTGGEPGTLSNGSLGA